MTGPSRQIVVSEGATDRFWKKVDKTANCWLWTASLASKGYGAFGMNGRWVFAHRYSWVLKNGAIPEGLLVLHSCDTPACVNPDHLFLGTGSDNMKDMARKARGYHIGYAAKTHCKYGHEFTHENTYRHPVSNRRECRTCHRRHNNNRSAALRAAAGSAPTHRR